MDDAAEWIEKAFDGAHRSANCSFGGEGHKAAFYGRPLLLEPWLGLGSVEQEKIVLPDNDVRHDVIRRRSLDPSRLLRGTP
jgi:hypothetical protein